MFLNEQEDLINSLGLGYELVAVKNASNEQKIDTNESNENKMSNGYN